MKATRGYLRVFLVGVAALALVGIDAAPGGAATPNLGVGTVSGSGTIAPGLDDDPLAQTFDFTSTTITTSGTVNKTTYVLDASSCDASGGSLDDTEETVAAGAGDGTWSCDSGALNGKGGSLSYVRAGAAVSVVLTAGTTQVGALQCVFIPTSTSPVESYDLHCAGAAGGVK